MPAATLNAHGILRQSADHRYRRRPDLHLAQFVIARLDRAIHPTRKPSESRVMDTPVNHPVKPGEGYDGERFVAKTARMPDKIARAHRAAGGLRFRPAGSRAPIAPPDLPEKFNLPRSVIARLDRAIHHA